MQAIAARVGSPTPTFVEVREPSSPRPDEVLCRTLQLGVCGTDREILLSESPLVQPGLDRLILGHECLAQVVEVGSNVTDLGVGELVVPVVRRHRDLGNKTRVDLLAFGEYTERGIVWEDGFSSPHWLDHPRNLYRVSPELRQVAVLTEPISVAEKGIHEALLLQQIRLGTAALSPRVLVTGMGPIGFSAVLGCRHRGWDVTVYGRDGESSPRVDLLNRLGARYRHQDEFAQGPADTEQDGFDLILECTGADCVILETAEWLAARGTMVWLGSSRQPQARALNLDSFVRNALLRNHLLIGSVNAAPRDFASALQILAELPHAGGNLAKLLITSRIAPQDALWHYEQREPQGVKTVVMFDA